MDESQYAQSPRVVNRKYGEYFVPALLTVMATNLASIVDSALAGNLLGRDALGATGLYLPISQLLFSLTIFLGLGGSTCIARCRGRGQSETADRVFTLCVTLALGLGVLGSGAMLLLRGPIVAALSGASGLDELVSGYYLPYAAGLPLNLLMGCLVYYIRLDGRPKFTTAILIVSNLVNLAGDYLFMGVLKAGIAGASIATDLAVLVGLGMVASHYLQRRNTVHWDKTLFHAWGQAGRLAMGIFSTGLSGALNTLLASFRIQFFNFLCLSLAGSAALSAFSVCNSSLMLVSMFISGASQAMIPMVGVLAGEEDYPGIRAVFRRAFWILLLSSVAVAVFVLAFPGPILTLFGMPGGSAAERTALRLGALSFPLNAVVFLLMYLYMALGKKGLAGFIAAMNGLVLAIPAAWVLSVPLGINGVWLSAALTGVLTLLAIALAVHILKGRSNGQYADFFLLPLRAEDELYALSAPATAESAAGLGALLEKILLADGMERSLANRLAYVAEGAVENIALRSAGRRVELDLRLLREGERLKLILRDNGRPFNATVDDPGALGADVRATAEDMIYVNLLGWNRLTILVRRELHGTVEAN